MYSWRFGFLIQAQKIFTTLFLGSVFSLVPITIYARAAPSLIISIGTVSCLLMLIARKELSDILPPFRHLILFSLFCLWATFTSLWSGTPGISLITGLRLIAVLLSTAILFAALNAENSKNTLNLLGIGLMTALFLLLNEAATQSMILKYLSDRPFNPAVYGHAITLVALATWPVLAFCLKRNLILAALILPAVFLVVFPMHQHAVKLALTLGTGVFLLSFFNPRFCLRLGAVLSAVIVLGFPFLITAIDPVKLIQKSNTMLLKPSYHHRLFILKRTSEKIFEKPLVGHGLNSFKETFDKNKLESQKIEETFKSLSEGKEVPIDLEVLGQGIHPHNLSMQIWYDLGFIGALLFASFLLIGLWRLSNLQTQKLYLSSFVALYTTAFVIAHLSFGAWQTWWLFSLAFFFTLGVKQAVIGDSTSSHGDVLPRLNQPT